MKTYILIVFFSFFSVVSFSQKIKWETNYLEAVSKSQSENKNIIVYFIDGKNEAKEQLINESLFGTKTLKKISKKFIFLKVDESNTSSLSSDNKTYNYRMLHVYNPKRKFPSIQLITKNANKQADLVTNISVKKIDDFIELLLK